MIPLSCAVWDGIVRVTASSTATWTFQQCPSRAMQIPEGTVLGTDPDLTVSVTQGIILPMGAVLRLRAYTMPENNIDLSCVPDDPAVWEGAPTSLNLLNGGLVPKFTTEVDLTIPRSTQQATDIVTGVTCAPVIDLVNSGGYKWYPIDTFAFRVALRVPRIQVRMHC